MTIRQILGAGLGRTLLTVAAAALLIVGPTLNTATEDGGFGMAAAARGGGGGARGGGGGARGGGGGARGGGGGGGYSRPSSVDRAPRQASASRGSIGGANRDFSASSRPAGVGGASQARPQAQQRPQAQARPQVQDRPASRPEVKRPEGGAKVAQARPADATKRSKPQVKTQDRAELSKKMQTHEGPKAGARGETGRLAGAAGAGALAGAGAGALAGGVERGGAGGERQGDRGQRQEDRAGQRGDRQGERGQRQEDRPGQREERQGERGQAQDGRQADRGQRQDDRTGQRDERRQDTQQNREDRRQNVDERRKEYADNREDIRNDRQDRMNEWREDRQDFAEDWREDRQDLWEDVYDDHHYWGDWDDDDWWDDDDDDGWVWGLVGGVVGYAIGAAVNSPPEGTVTVPYAGTNYQYYGGAFYQPAPAGTAIATTADTSGSAGSGAVTYVTVPAPVGAVVEAPPLDCTIVYGPDPKDPGYCYFGGAFFLYDEKTDKYVVAEPPVGTEVPYLPEGYTVEKVGDREFYKLGPTYYRHYMAGDDEVFVVAKA